MKPKLKIIKNVDLHDPEHWPFSGIINGVVIVLLAAGLVSIIYMAFGR